MASPWSTHLLGLLVLSILCITTANVEVWGICGYGLDADGLSKPDPYVKVYCGGQFGGMTEFKKNDANPCFSASFSFPKGRVGDILKLELFDKDAMFDDRLGTCTVRVKQQSHAQVSCTLKKGSLEFNYGI